MRFVGPTVIVLLLCVPVRSSIAAEIKYAMTPNCDIQLSGLIEPGDSDKLKQLLYIKDADKGFRAEAWTVDDRETPAARSIPNDGAQLCLRSEGGSFAEAVKIIKLILGYIRPHGGFTGLATVVEANSECLSACALVFMAGRAHRGDGYIEMLRFMHPTAMVGFHGPFNQSTAPSKDPQLLARAQQAGVNAVADLVELDDDLFPRTLLKTFLRVRGSEFYYASTIDDIGKWKIELFDYRKPMVSTLGQLIDYCDNTYRWKVDQVKWTDPSHLTAIELSDEDKKRVTEENKRQEKMRAQPVSPAKGVTWFTLGEYGSETNERCSIQIFRGKHDYIRATIHGVPDDPQSFTRQAQSAETAPDNSRVRSIGESLWRIFPGETKLTDLYPSSNPARLFSSYSDPRPEYLSKGIWKMNGAQVKIANSNGNWTVSLQEPNTSLRRAGVKRGTILLRWTQNKGTVSGTAFLYSLNCQPVAVPVSGMILNNRIFKLKGTRAASSGPCGTATPNPVSLQFSFEPDRMMI